jgi:hypothetical protein
MRHSHLRLGSFGYVTPNFVFCLYSHYSFCYSKPSEHHVLVNWHTKFWVALLVWSLDLDCWRNYEGIKLTNSFECKVKASVFFLSLVQRETNQYLPFHFSRIRSIWRHGNCEKERIPLWRQQYAGESNLVFFSYPQSNVIWILAISFLEFAKLIGEKLPPLSE